MRITLDTNVLLRAHRNASGPPHRILQEILHRPHELILSQTMLYELEEVFAYPHIKKLTKLSSAEIADYLDELARFAILVDIGRPQPFGIRDVDDWTVVRTAISGRASVLCSGDRHLRHWSLTPIYEQYNIEVLDEIELLTRMLG